MKQIIIDCIQQIPVGRVVSYGVLAEQINILTDVTTSGRMVGRLLSNMSLKERKYESVCPRWRVVNKQGVVSSLKLGEKGIVQIDILRDEGIEVIDGRVDMEKYEWRDWQIK